MTSWFMPGTFTRPVGAWSCTEVTLGATVVSPPWEFHVERFPSRMAMLTLAFWVSERALGFCTPLLRWSWSVEITVWLSVPNVTD